MFANRYEFIAGAGDNCFEFCRLLSALEMTGRRSVNTWRGNIREIWHICFAAPTFYVFCFIKEKGTSVQFTWKLIGADIQVLSKSALYHLTHNITSISMTFTII